VDVNDDRMAWAFVIERDGAVEVEELFVRPQFGRRRYGSKMLRTIHAFAGSCKCPFRMDVDSISGC